MSSLQIYEKQIETVKKKEQEIDKLNKLIIINRDLFNKHKSLMFSHIKKRDELRDEQSKRVLNMG